MFRPTFPLQHLLSKPELVIKVANSNPSLRGHIDISRPHAVNQLIIGNLGNQEVLLVSCDDGDVIGYEVREIQKAIEEQKGSTAKCDVTPFFLENMGNSCWGLAIHTAARLIAASANGGRIIVFAFALTRPQSLEKTSRQRDREDAITTKVCGKILGARLSPLWRVVRAEHLRQPLKLRYLLNVAFEIKGHHENIPNISFFNQDNRKNIYLASTDVDGWVCVHSVWEQMLLFRRRVGMCSVRLPNVNATKARIAGSRGWGVICLDPRSSCSTGNDEETYGCPAPNAPKVSQVDRIDNSGCIATISDFSLYHPRWPEHAPAPSTNIAEDIMSEALSDEESSEDCENDGPEQTVLSDEDTLSDATGKLNDLIGLIPNFSPTDHDTLMQVFRSNYPARLALSTS